MRWTTLFHVLLVGFVLLATQPAQADQFSFSYSFSAIPGFPTPVSASGILTTTSLDPVSDTYTITDISGTRLFEGVSQNITGLIAPGGYAGNDNLLSVADPYLTANGFSYTVDGVGNTGPDVNVFYNAFQGGYTENGDTIGVGTFTVTPLSSVPEAGTLSIALLGLASLTLAARRRYAH